MSFRRRRRNAREQETNEAEEEEEEEEEEENSVFEEMTIEQILNHRDVVPKKKLKFVRELFNRVSEKYDVMNVLISFGFTSYWRLKALRGLQLRMHAKVLDVGCGSGASTARVLKRYKGICVECDGIDPSEEMINVAKKRNADARAHYRVGNIENTDGVYEDDTFDAVITVYTLRNFADSQIAIWQMMRILKPGGKLVVLDAFPPQFFLARFFLRLWLDYVMPIVALVFIRDEKDRKAYRYLSKSIQKAKYTPETFVHALGNKGAINMKVTKYMFGACCKIECEKLYLKRDEQDPLQRYKSEDKRPYYEPMEWTDFIFPLFMCFLLSSLFSKWIMSLELE
jgi:demethylmenaquinone methyltransferase / 2-methoxy-6-polyprenyl-1,4-benzoquinol methylase